MDAPANGNGFSSQDLPSLEDETSLGLVKNGFKDVEYHDDDDHEASETGEEDNEDDIDQDDDTQSEEDEDEDEDEDEEDEPPLLKYTRLSQLPKQFFNKELISSFLTIDTHLIFGTSSGLLYVTNSELKQIGAIRVRKSPIYSMHSDGHHIIAGSMDGTIIITTINQIATATNIQAYDVKATILSVVILDKYTLSKSFIYSNKAGQVVQSSTNWLGNRSEKVLYQDDLKPIVKLEMLGKYLLCWINDDGIFFYNLTTQEIIHKIPKPFKFDKIPTELILPKIHHPEYDRLIIGWMNHVWSLKIDGIIPSSISSPTMNNFIISSAMSSFSKPHSDHTNTNGGGLNDVSIITEYEYDLKDGLIAGISTFKDDSLVLLTLENTLAENSKGQFRISNNKSNTHRGINNPPELKILKCLNNEEIMTDEIILKNYEILKINDFKITQIFNDSSSSKYLILCSTDCIVAEEYSLKDRFDWFLTRSKYLECWEIGEHLIPFEERCEIGIKHVEQLIDQDNWISSSTFLSKILNVSNDDSHLEFLKEKWSQWSWIFIHSGKHKELASILPKDSESIVSQDIYDELLEWFLENDQVSFHEYLSDWDLSIFNHTKIESKLESYLEVDLENTTIRRLLADLYLKSDNPINAIKHFIILKDPLTLELINKFHLLASFIQEIPKIVKFEIPDDTKDSSSIEDSRGKYNKIINLLVAQRHEISFKKFSKIFQDEDLEIINYLYLEKIAETDELSLQPFETELIYYFAQYEPSKLLSFLKKHSNYDVGKTIKIMETDGLYSELVYLLGKVGQYEQAMNLIIDRMDDPKQAIEFILDLEKSDGFTKSISQNLWNLFLDKGLQKPNFIKIVIEYTGIYFDSKILQKIPNNVEIEGLKNSIIRIAADNDISLTLHSIILNILELESLDNFNKLNELRFNGSAITPKRELLENLGEDAELIVDMNSGELKILDQ